jgi:multiple sugar transport system substrate-binding protein
MAFTELKGMTWDHPRALDSLVASNDLLKSSLGISISWDARSLLAFGDQHISEFYEEYDLMIIDHPHVPDAVHAGAVLPFEELLSADELAILARTSVGPSHDSYLYQGKHWALAIDTAAQVSAFRPDMSDASPVFWSDVLELAKTGKLLWPYKPVDAYSTFATLMAQKGAPLAVSNLFIKEDTALEVLSMMVELAALVPDFCSKSNPIDIAEELSSGDTYSHGICLYGYSNYSHTGFRKHSLIYEDIPSFDGLASGSQIGGAGIAISSTTSNPVAASQASLMLCLPEIQSTTYGLSGGQPGNLIAWKNHRLNEVTAGFYSNTLRTLERSWVRPRLLGWPDVQFQISLVIQKVLLESKFNKATVNQIAGLYSKHIKE